MPGGLPGLPQRRDHHGEVILQVVGTTVPIPIRRERLDELAEYHQHCRSVHAAIDRDRARLHCLVNYRGELDHSIKRVLALHNATGARDLGSLPTRVPDHESPHRGVQALIDGDWLAHVDHSNPWRATPGGRSEPGGMVTAPGCGELGGPRCMRSGRWRIRQHRHIYDENLELNRRVSVNLHKCSRDAVAREKVQPKMRPYKAYGQPGAMSTNRL